MLKLVGKTKTELLQLASSVNTSSLDRYILADAEFPEVLATLMKRHSLSSEIIAAIGENPNSRNAEVVTLLSTHKNTPSETIQSLLDEDSKIYTPIVLKNTSPEKLKMITPTAKSKEDIKIAMVKSTGLDEAKLVEIYNELTKEERVKTFNKLFALNPFSGPVILGAVLSESKDKEEVLAIAGNRSAGDTILLSIFNSAKAKDIDIANALISNSRTPKSLGEDIFEKFNKKLDEKTITSMIKRNMSLFSEKTLANLFEKTDLGDEKRKVVRLLEKNESIFRLMLPVKMLEEQKRWIIGKTELPTLKEFAKVAPDAEDILVNYWSKISGQESASENNEKMKRLFSEEVWKGKTLEDYNGILHQTKNMEVVKAVLAAQDSPEVKEVLLLDKIASLSEDRVFEKIKNIAIKVKGTEGTTTPEIIDDLNLLGEDIELINISKKQELLTLVKDAVSDMSNDPVVLRKKATLAKLGGLWDAVSEFKENSIPLVVSEEEKPNGGGDIFYIRSFSQAYEIASQIGSTRGMESSLVSMSHRERVSKLKENILFNSGDREKISLIIENSIPTFVGAIGGTKEKSKLSTQITEIEREVLRTEDKEYIAICESKRCFPAPVTQEGVQTKLDAVKKYSESGFSKLSVGEKNEFIGPLFDHFTSDMVKEFKNEGDLMNLLDYTEETFGVQKLKKVIQAISENTKEMSLPLAWKLMEFNNLPFPIKEQREKFENSIAEKLLSWDTSGEVAEHISKIKYGNPEKIEEKKPEIKSILVETPQKEKVKEEPSVDKAATIKPMNLFEFADAQMEEPYLKL